MKTRFFMIFLLFYFVPSFVFAATHYCSPRGVASWSASTNYSKPCSLATACSNVSAGDTVILKDGTYSTDTGNNCILYLSDKNGTSSNHIVFEAENNLGAVFTSQSRKAGIWVRKCKYVDFKGIYIHDTQNGIYIPATGTEYDIEYITFTRCKVKNIHSWRVKYDSGVHAQGMFTGAYTRRITVDRCWFENIGFQPNLSQWSSFEWHNYVHDHAWYAMGGGHVVKNSIFVDMNAGWAVSIRGWSGPNDFTNSIEIINCTFGNHNTGRASRSSSIALFNHSTAAHNGHIEFHRDPSTQDYYGKNVIIANCVFWQPPHSPYVTTGSSALNIRGATEISGTSVYNCVTDASSMNRYKTDQDSSDFAAYIGNYVSVNPSTLGMTDPYNDDYALTSSAEYLIDKGDFVNAPKTDFKGIARPQGQAIDIGAYEFSDESTASDPGTIEAPRSLGISNVSD